MENSILNFHFVFRMTSLIGIHVGCDICSMSGWAMILIIDLMVFYWSERRTQKTKYCRENIGFQYFRICISHIGIRAVLQLVQLWPWVDQLSAESFHSWKIVCNYFISFLLIANTNILVWFLIFKIPTKCDNAHLSSIVLLSTWWLIESSPAIRISRMIFWVVGQFGTRTF